MSMMGRFRAISDSALNVLKNNPNLIKNLVSAHSFGAQTGEDSENEFEKLLSQVPLPAAAKKEFQKMTPEEKQQIENSMREEFGKLDPQILRSFRKLSGESYCAIESAGILPTDVAEELDIQKAWHGLHYLLCESGDPVPGVLGSSILGGKELGPDLGYGPARYLTVESLRSTASALNEISTDTLRARYNPARMTGLQIYPGVWDREDEDVEWLLLAFEDLRQYYFDAENQNRAMLLYIV
ncbi:MAG TPA: YfbM family protein [Blastocatellia bacterium]|nr:YfbM family protein [Blastocatellia bacterium]